MRLIDADALEYMQIGFTNAYVRKEDIDNAPTIEERKPGKWIPMTVSSGRDSWKCSVCGRRARGKIENLPYCHCGAKMMKGEQNG